MKGEKTQLNFRISEDLAESLREVSEEREIPQSQIVREAIREKVMALRGSESVPVITPVAVKAA